MARARPFDELSATGRARRLRPLAVAALDQWRLEVRRVRLLSNDYNGVWRVDATEGRFVLRVSLPLRTDAELRAEIDWLRALADADAMSAPVPVPTAAGDRWAVASAAGVPGSRRCVLFRWLPGRAMRVDDGTDLFEGLGARTATLHAHAATWRRPRGAPVWERPFSVPRTPTILFDRPLGPSVRSVYRGAEQAAIDAYGRLRRRGERPTIAHHDVHIDNALTNRGSISLIDFDDCAIAYRAEDLGRSVFQNRMRGCDERRLDAFRRGYEAVAAWPDPSDVEAFVAAAAMELANDVYQDFDPDYQAAAADFAARWARIARASLKRLG